MRPTRRGIGVAVVGVATAVVGAQFGQPALGAVAGPLLVAIAVAAGQLSMSGRPVVERSSLRPGFPGETHTVELDIDGAGVARLTDARPEGISGPATATRALPATVRYDVRYDQRGVYRLGPVAVCLTDTLGLVYSETTVEAIDDVVVYPSVYRLGGPDAFVQSVLPETADRQAFDRLREYEPGDSLRDIHWKSSAKRDELLVTEFDDERGDQRLLVAAEAKQGHADAMATAAATVAIGALESGFDVAVATPDGSVEHGHGDSQRTRILETLARTTSGTSERTDDADVVVWADGGGVTVTADGQQRAFETVTPDNSDPLSRETRA